MATPPYGITRPTYEVERDPFGQDVPCESCGSIDFYLIETFSGTRETPAEYEMRCKHCGEVIGS